MIAFPVWLTKDGLQRPGEEGPETFVPTHVFDLLSVWHCPLAEIDPDYTLGDLCAMLREVDEIERLSGMFGCELGAFLDEAATEPAEEDDDCPVRFLEVYNEVEPTGYEEDPEHPDEPTRLVDSDEARAHEAVHELIGEALPFRMVESALNLTTGEVAHRHVLPGTYHGSWTGPFNLRRGFRGWGAWSRPSPEFFARHPEIDPADFEGGFRLEFAPMNEVAHLPLRYNPRVSFYERKGHMEPRFDEEVTITFGELVHAVFATLGSLGTPEERDQKHEIMDEHMRDVRREMREGDEDDEPWR